MAGELGQVESGREVDGGEVVDEGEMLNLIPVAFKYVCQSYEDYTGGGE